MARSIHEKVAAVHHVVHDYTNLVSAGELVQTELSDRINSHVQHIFLMNCRTLAYFFTNGGRPDDIKSEDFLTGEMTFTLPTWEDWRDQMDKHLMHLTYARVDNTRPWSGGVDNQKILQEMQSTWALFLSKIEEPFKSEFDKEIGKKECSDFRGCKLR